MANLALNTRNTVVLVLVGFLLIVVPLLSVKVHRRTSIEPSSTPSNALEHPSRYAVIKDNFPDPCLVEDVGGKHYAFAGSNATMGINIQTASAVSTDLCIWTLHAGQDALPVLGDWALKPSIKAQVWAPDVTQRPDGQWVLYYSALHKDHPRTHCIGAATSGTITGPYQPGPSPLACDLEAGGAIDPSHFHDPLTGDDWLIWKSDGNAIGSGGACDNSNMPNKPTPLRAMLVNSTDLISPLKEAHEILENFPEDGPNIEGPQAWYTDTPIPTYHLMYSSGCYHDQSYKLKHIVCFPNTTADVVESGAMTAWELCSWQLAISLPLLGWPDEENQGWRVGEFLKSGDMLVPGQHDSKVYAPGGAGVGHQGGQVMVFHGDLNLDFFRNPRETPRVRGMFVMGLAYPEKKDRLAMGTLHFQGAQK